MKNKTIVELKNISYEFHDTQDRKRVPALKRISFKIPQGEFVTILGPSGCGKSTLLRIVAGLIKPNFGQFFCSANKSTMIFQHFGLFPWLTVKENIEFGLKMNGVSEKQRNVIVKSKIKETGLSGFSTKSPHELSGGMKQRVGIARALAVQPDLLLADEPFSNLDFFTAEKLRKDTLDLWKKYKMTIVMVTHLIEEAVELSDRIIVSGPRPAVVKKEIVISLPRPRDKRSPEFFKICDQINRLISKK
jgi:NitT/TauT family transport system ATP-binding protein